MKTVLIFLAAVGFASIAPAAAPFIERIEVFEAGKGGYALYRIPGLVVTSKGTVLAYCEARRSGSDWSTIDLMIRRSTDSGKTWAVAAKVEAIPGAKTK